MIAGSSFPTPVPGLVIRYSYLWASEHGAGAEEGRKDRPCAIVVCLLDEESELRVVVLPITHLAPSNAEEAVEIPLKTKLRLGLDDQRSWVVLTEANLFSWPGPDLRPSVNGDLSTIAYGLLPASLFRSVRDRVVDAIRNKRMRVTSRTR